jgi:hypothetical protein
MRYHPIVRSLHAMILATLPLRVASAQTANGVAFPPLPSTGVVCTVTPAPNDLKRGGIWQMLQIQAPSRSLSVALDAKQRLRFLYDMGATSAHVRQPVNFDSTGAVHEFPVRPSCGTSPPKKGSGRANSRLTRFAAARPCPRSSDSTSRSHPPSTRRCFRTSPRTGRGRAAGWGSTSRPRVAGSPSGSRCTRLNPRGTSCST